MYNNLMETTNLTPIEIMLKVDKDGFVLCKNLYDFLELEKKNYSRWCKANIDDNIFAEESVDYEVFVMREENPQGGRPTKDYKLSAAFAKKVAMMSKTQRGEQARCYFDFDS